MKDFANAAFAPDQIKAMEEALQGAVATLPEPVSAHRVQAIAESILRSAQQGESDTKILQTMALVEMQLSVGPVASIRPDCSPYCWSSAAGFGLPSSRH